MQLTSGLCGELRKSVLIWFSVYRSYVHLQKPAFYRLVSSFKEFLDDFSR